MDEASEQGLTCHPMSIPIGYGTSGLGNLYEVIPDAVADATLAEAWQAGFRYFDTSPFYGFGLSELRVGRFLRSVPRESFILSTKVGRYMTPPRGEPVDKLHWAGAARAAAGVRLQLRRDHALDRTIDHPPRLRAD